MHAVIHSNRTGLGFPVVVREPTDAPDTLRPMVRSLLRAIDEDRLAYDEGHTDSRFSTLASWRFTVETSDGWKRDYTFNGAEVVRGGAYVPATLDEIRETMRIFTRDEKVTIGDDFDSLTHPDDEVAPASAEVTTLDRAAINRRDNARRVLAKAMGYSGNKDWAAAGYPLNREVATGSDNPASIKPHKYDGKVADAEIPSATSGIPTYSQSVIRPGKIDTGMHSAIGSHNK